MTLAQYIVRKMEQAKVTDAFGVPGSVILNLLYEIDSSSQINIHLNYHEQTAAYAACGYAQCSQQLGVAYATKGPGITNMITSIADAYYDSSPTLFITAHSQINSNEKMRIETDQELNIVPMVKNITKYAVKIDDLKYAKKEINQAFFCAQSERKGPVLIDVLSSLFKQEIDEEDNKVPELQCENAIDEYSDYIFEEIQKSDKPILLIGDGVKQSGMSEYMKRFSNRYHIPILSSRYAQDIMPNDDMYFGYVGSHATRYSNFILDKADLIIAMGNRMAYPISSNTFNDAIKNSKIIRIDIDDSEFERKIPNSRNIKINLAQLLPCLVQSNYTMEKKKEWISVCKTIKEKLYDVDIDAPTKIISGLLQQLNEKVTLVCDVGNNELWVSRAYAYSGIKNILIHSKSFKTVGCAIGKSIGVYYATQNPVVCFVGDQGFQFNLQELEYISQHKLPVLMVVCNNASSGMLRMSEKRGGYSYCLHTDLESGYANPDFKSIANSYKLEYQKINVANYDDANIKNIKSGILELTMDSNTEIKQYLPKGNPCQKFFPEIDQKLYNYIEQL